jgi:hypothetical protein
MRSTRVVRIMLPSVGTEAPLVFNRTAHSQKHLTKAGQVNLDFQQTRI